MPIDQSFGFDIDPVDEIVAAASIAHGVPLSYGSRQSDSVFLFCYINFLRVD